MKKTMYQRFIVERKGFNVPVTVWLFIVLFLVTGVAVGLALMASIKVLQLEIELKELKDIVNGLEHPMQDNFIEELSKFENEYNNEDSEENTTTRILLQDLYADDDYEKTGSDYEEYYDEYDFDDDDDDIEDLSAFMDILNKHNKTELVNRNKRALGTKQLEQNNNGNDSDLIKFDDRALTPAELKKQQSSQNSGKDDNGGGVEQQKQHHIRHKRHKTRAANIQGQGGISDMAISRDEVQTLPIPRRRHKAQRLETFDEGAGQHGYKMSRMRSLAAIHYSGDTSKYVYGQHSNFKGNGHLQHASKKYIDWKENEWVKTLGMRDHFNMKNGILNIKEAGLYLIYAQIYYLDEHDTNSFAVFKNGENILQCTTTSHTAVRTFKGNTCYTSGVEFLSEEDEITLEDMSHQRYSIFEPGKSFFGLVKLAELKTK